MKLSSNKILFKIWVQAQKASKLKVQKQLWTKSVPNSQNWPDYIETCFKEDKISQNILDILHHMIIALKKKRKNWGKSFYLSILETTKNMKNLPKVFLSWNLFESLNWSFSSFLAEILCDLYFLCVKFLLLQHSAQKNFMKKKKNKISSHQEKEKKSFSRCIVWL